MQATQLNSLQYDSTGNSRYPLQSSDNPIPYGHIKAKGMKTMQDEINTPYIAVNKQEIKRGDLSIMSTNHYWPNYFSDFSLYYPTKPPWADTEETKNITFNSIDNGIDRTSHHGPYALLPYIFENFNSNFKFGKFPVNPVGRTGITGRGQLGKWGPNHAADPIMMTRKPDGIYFVSIQRRDNGEWALPGGMVEVGDNVSITLKKEFGEEAMNTLKMTPEEQEVTKKQLDKVFKSPILVYKGYVDDPRNTDNSWMETVAMLIVVDKSVADTFKLNAGDDAGKVRWKKYESGIKLYASHANFVNKAIELMGQL